MLKQALVESPERGGGTTDPSAKLERSNAGKTAPGGGVQISEGAVYAPVDIRTTDVIWRYIRVRKGFNEAGRRRIWRHDDDAPRLD